jgi:hypothetical protein
MDGPHKPTKCCLCDNEAVAIYYMSRGCVARPDSTIQPLCPQHENKMTPLGGAELLKDLRVGPIA